MILREDDYYGTKEKQELLLNLLIKTDELFKKYSISYSLCGGSLLGAVRHNGFIPWDDDLDIMLSRKNFNRLKKLPEKLFSKVGLVMKRDLWVYRIYYLGNDNRFSDPTIDIFVSDYVPDSYIVSKIKIFILRILQGMLHEKIDIKKHSLFEGMCLLFTFIIGKIFPSSVKYKCYDAVSQWGKNGTKKYCALYNDLYRLLHLRYPGDLLKKLELHSFEDMMFPITKKYDEFLKLQYGDYMKLPPKSKRTPEHTI